MKYPEHHAIEVRMLNISITFIASQTAALPAAQRQCCRLIVYWLIGSLQRAPQGNAAWLQLSTLSYSSTIGGQMVHQQASPSRLLARSGFALRTLLDHKQQRLRVRIQHQLNIHHLLLIHSKHSRVPE